MSMSLWRRGFKMSRLCWSLNPTSRADLPAD